MKISGGSRITKNMDEDGSAAVIDGLWDEYERLAASRLVSAEESEAMIVFIREMRDLQERVGSGQGLAGPLKNKELRHLELEGMIKLFRSDLSLVRMRSSA